VLNNVNESTSGICLTERKRTEKAANPRTLRYTILDRYFVLKAVFKPRLKAQGNDRIKVMKKLKKII
jgi:hypothetical protein